MRSSATLIAVVVAGACTVFAAPIIPEAAIAEGQQLDARWTVPYGTGIMAVKGIDAVRNAANNGKRWDLPQVPPGVWYMAAKAADPNSFQRRDDEDLAFISSGPGPVMTPSEVDNEQSSRPMVIASNPEDNPETTTTSDPQNDAVTAQSQSDDKNQTQKHHHKGEGDEHSSNHQQGEPHHDHNNSKQGSEKHGMGQKFNSN